MKSSRLNPRLVLIVGLGLMAIVASLVVRNSRWAIDRRLQSMSVDELALATRDSPNESLAHFYYAAGLFKSGDAFASEQEFRRVVQLEPSMSKAQLGLANALMAQGKLREAVETFKVAARLDKSNPDPHMGLAHAYDMAGSSILAIEPLKQVVTLRPKNASAWYALGRMYGSSHQWEHAYFALNQATKLDAKNAEVWREAAQASLKCNKLQEAEEQATKAVKLNSSDPVSHFILGKVYSTMGDDPMTRGKAEVCFMSATARDPDMPQAHFELAQLYERSGNLPMAESRFRQTVKLDPSDDQALYRLGLCMVKRGNISEGNKLVKAAQELGSVRREMANLRNRGAAEPNNMELRLRLARLCRKYGDEEGARQAYQECQRIGEPAADVKKEIDEFVSQLNRSRNQSTSLARGTRESPSAETPQK